MTNYRYLIGIILSVVTFPIVAVQAAPSVSDLNGLKASKEFTPPPVSQQQQQVVQTKPVRTGVYGEWLFDGKFAGKSFTGFNPNYLINVGDTILLKLWGAVDLELPLVVDPQGNIFVPRVGPINLLNVRNENVSSVVEQHIKSIYRENVGVYASLSAAQQVKVFVSGNVLSPGLYEGFSADSALHFLDKAGGIAPDRGSYLDIRLLRDGRIAKQINLYDFLLNGRMPNIQFRDGDTLFVAPLNNTVSFSGLVNNPYQLEFVAGELYLDEALKIVGVMPNATHVRITRNQGAERNVEYVPLSSADNLKIQSGDKVTVLADKTIGSIIVQVEGEHVGLTEYVVPYGSKLGDLLKQIRRSPQSDVDNIQLFRRSLAERQKFMLEQSLRALENNVLSARSETLGEAGLRSQEAQLVLQFIERASKIEPRGQVVLGQSESKMDVTLEDGDRIRVPKKSNLVSVHGEVYFPSAFLYQQTLTPEDYIEKAGGFSQKADKSRVLIMHQNGSVEQYEAQKMFRTSANLVAGDEILIMPEVDFKSFQFTKDLVEVIYQIAVSAGVILRI